MAQETRVYCIQGTGYSNFQNLIFVKVPAAETPIKSTEEGKQCCSPQASPDGSNKPLSHDTCSNSKPFEEQASVALKSETLPIPEGQSDGPNAVQKSDIPHSHKGNLDEENDGPNSMVLLPADEEKCNGHNRTTSSVLPAPHKRDDTLERDVLHAHHQKPVDTPVKNMPPSHESETNNTPMEGPHEEKSVDAPKPPAVKESLDSTTQGGVRAALHEDSISDNKSSRSIMKPVTSTTPKPKSVTTSAASSPSARNGRRAHEVRHTCT